MVVVAVYSECVKYKYKTTLLSKSTVFLLTINMLNIILPFLLAYKSRGLWLKHDTFYEQPNVKFNGEYVFNAITNNLSSPIVCTSLPFYNREILHFNQCSQLKVKELDKNFDGKCDELVITLFVRKPPSVKIVNLILVIFLDYKLEMNCLMHMQAAATVQERAYVGSGIHVVGDLILKQTSPIFCKSKHWYTPYNYSVIGNLHGIEGYMASQIMLDYSKRNVSTYVSYVHAATDTYEDSYLSIKVHVRIPEHKYYYRTELLQLLKWAWIQYLATYIIFYWVLERLKRYVFETRLFLFRKTLSLDKAIK